MEVWILDQSLEQVAYIDSFSSLIWTDAYNEYGEFELVCAMNPDTLEACARDNYVYFKESDRLMIINKVVTESDAEEGASLTVSGYSLESLLARRVVWGGKKTYKGSVANAIYSLIRDSIVSPSDSSRKISNFEILESTDSAVTSVTMEDAEYEGDNIYTIVKDLCYTYNLGFKIVYSFSTKKFIFSLYKGADRSYSQSENPYVKFSPKYENLLSSEYESSSEDYANVAMIQGSTIGDADSSEEKGKKTVTKTGTKSVANKLQTTVETTTTIVYNKSGKQMSKSVEKVTTVQTKDGYEEPNTAGTSSHATYEKTTTETQEYDANNVKHTDKRVVDETNTTTTKTRVKDGNGNVNVTRTVTDSTTKHSEDSTTLDKITSVAYTTVKHTDADGDGFETSATETVTYTKDTETAKDSTVRTTYGSGSGILRRELFVDAQDVATTDDNKRPLTKSAYTSKLKNKGQTQLNDYKEYDTYTGETDPKVMYTYGEDYFLGDIVQLENEFGTQGTSRITAFTWSQTQEKTTALPTFSAVKEDGESN